MKSFMSICLNKQSKTPIYKQLGDALLALIEDGILKPKTKLPTIRKMAECLKINSSTVVSAYKYLERNNAVYSAHGSGIYVSPPGFADRPKDEKAHYNIAPTKIKADFTSAYEHIFDSRLLSDLIGGRLEKEGVKKESDWLFMSASYNGLILAAKTIVTKNDYVVVEKPVSFNCITPYLECGAKILQVDINNEGMDTDKLETLFKSYRPKALHVTSYFQNPTGICYSIENKRKILELCNKYNVWIVEEDNFSSLAPSESRLFLKELDCLGKVIYVKNLTKLPFPYISFYVSLLPSKLAKKAGKLEKPMTGRNDSLIFKDIYELIISKTFDLTVDNIVKNYNDISCKIAQKLDDELGGFIEYKNTAVGAGFWIRLKKGDSTVLGENLAKRGVLIVPGNVYYGADFSGFFKISFVNLDTNYLEEGLEIISNEIKLLNNLY